MSQKFDVFLRCKLIGAYWKLNLVIEIAKLLGMKIEYYSGGSQPKSHKEEK